MLAGARSLTAIAEWMADAPRRVLLALGFAFDPFSEAVTVPHPTTVMRLLTRLDGDALDAAVSAFLQARAADRSTAKARWRAIAVDGARCAARERPAGQRCGCWPRWTTPERSSPSGRSTRKARQPTPVRRQSTGGRRAANTI
ncbi:transposase family protein [Streptomyces californicus]|uniref:transposase family protein n=1 Tax=Streptomyces californicus TaxID=67351 RepID=UPI00406BAA07